MFVKAQKATTVFHWSATQHNPTVRMAVDQMFNIPVRSGYILFYDSKNF